MADRPFTISEPATLIQRAFDTKVSATDLERAFAALHALPPKHRATIAARVVCLIELFGDPQDRRQVTARVMAIDWRCQALGLLSYLPEFRKWSVSEHYYGGININPMLLEAAATEPLIELDGHPGFDANKFFKRVLAITKEKGHG